MNIVAIIPKRVFFYSDYEHDSDAAGPYTDDVILSLYNRSQKVKRPLGGVRNSSAKHVLCMLSVHMLK